MIFYEDGFVGFEYIELPNTKWIPKNVNVPDMGKFFHSFAPKGAIIVLFCIQGLYPWLYAFCPLGMMIWKSFLNFCALLFAFLWFVFSLIYLHHPRNIFTGKADGGFCHVVVFCPEVFEMR